MIIKLLGYLTLLVVILTVVVSVGVSLWNHEPTLVIPSIRPATVTQGDRSNCPSGVENLPRDWKITC